MAITDVKGRHQKEGVTRKGIAQGWGPKTRRAEEEAATGAHPGPEMEGTRADKKSPRIVSLFELLQGNLIVCKRLSLLMHVPTEPHGTRPRHLRHKSRVSRKMGLAS